MAGRLSGAGGAGPGHLFDLAGRVALVTGAGQNVGARIAEVLAAHGAAVAVNDVRVERATVVVDGIVRDGGQAAAVGGDVTDRAAVDALVQEVDSRLGPVDILVNNAGLPADGLAVAPFVDLDPAGWKGIVALNLDAVLLCTRAVLAGMVTRRWGRVVTIVSDAGRAGEPQLSVYGAAKAAAIGFTRSVAREVGMHGVTCNCVSLGSMKRADEAPESVERRARRYPVGRLGEPDDVAPAVLYFASPAAAWVTGQTLSVDGGYLTI